MSTRRSGVSREGGGVSNVWQTIYMDLMTIMMVYFVILWSAEQGSEAEGISSTIGDQTVRMVSLPGDVLFASGKHKVSGEGQKVFKTLFNDATVLNFDMGGLVRRQLVIHGHSDAVGKKDDNLQLGFQRAFAVYKEIAQYGPEVPDHVVLCTHADNTPTTPVPVVKGKRTPEQKKAIRAAHSKNRRITIEDKQVNTFSGE